MSTFKVQVVDAGDSPFRNGDTFDVDYDNGTMMNMKQRNAKVSGSVTADNIEAFRELYNEAKANGKETNTRSINNFLKVTFVFDITCLI